MVEEQKAKLLHASKNEGFRGVLGSSQWRASLFFCSTLGFSESYAADILAGLGGVTDGFALDGKSDIANELLIKIDLVEIPLPSVYAYRLPRSWTTWATKD